MAQKMCSRSSCGFSTLALNTQGQGLDRIFLESNAHVTVLSLDINFKKYMDGEKKVFRSIFKFQQLKVINFKTYSVFRSRDLMLYTSKSEKRKHCK